MLESRTSTFDYLHKPMIKKLISAAVLVAAGVAGYLYVESRVYYPVVRLLLPDGLSIAAVLPETKERSACEAANERFVAPFIKQCKECKVAARCERQLEGLE